jgi:hypothetical protein
MKTTTFARRLAATALIVSAGALGFATTAQAKPVMQIDAYNTCMKSLKPREGAPQRPRSTAVSSRVARGLGEPIPNAGVY